MRHSRIAIFLIINLVTLPTLILLPRTPVQAQPPAKNAPQDPGWPREKTASVGRLIYCQPQVDSWKDYKQLEFRTAFSLTPTGAESVVGIATIRAQTAADVEKRTVLLSNLEIIETTFPAVEDEATKPTYDALVKTFMPKDSTMTVALDRIVASLEKNETPVKSGDLKSDPPEIFFTNKIAIMVQIDGEPVFAKVNGTKNLEFIVNSNFPVFRDNKENEFYVYTGKQWLTASDPKGSWTRTMSLPDEMKAVKADKQWAGLAAAIPPPTVTEAVPGVFYSTTPAEVIMFQGQPIWSVVKGTNLLFVTNTNSDLFLDNKEHKYYYLASGRWFRSTSLDGPWTFATPDLPADFAKIPADSSAAKILSTVPGTEQAKDAVLISQVPTIAIVDPKAAEQAAVKYYGDPDFKPIEGTSLFYAVNTPEKVIKSGDTYYLCLNAVWFQSSAPIGPWSTAKSVPDEIYQIPASSPVYNVTYVKQEETEGGQIEASYTSGYMGYYPASYGWGSCMWWGTGWWYAPYFYYGMGYPYYWGWPVTYGWGAFAVGAMWGAAWGAWGPWRGGAGWGGYNPYTGTIARGARVSGPFGSRSAAVAYNRRTGTGAATRQGSGPYGSWGKSVVTRGGQTARTGHVTTGRGTTAGIRTSGGGAAIARDGVRGSGAAIKTAGGDMYAGRNGNVYRNTGSGWQKYNGNGNWGGVNTPTPHDRAGSRGTDAGTMGNLSSERSNRQRGATNYDRYKPSTSTRSNTYNRSNSGSRYGTSSGSRYGSGGYRGYGGGYRGGGGFRGGGRRR
ncbi:MAG: hypothetical protein DMF63_05450 [Acidobacteria bacterium]|nr:MAG: hypothetical protein DMF63_05450 [Acidobacteriota bacterium]